MKKLMLIFAFVAMAVSAVAKDVIINGNVYSITKTAGESEELQISKLQAAKNVYAVYLYKDGYHPNNITDGDWTYVVYDKASDTYYVCAGRNAKYVIFKDTEISFCTAAEFAQKTKEIAKENIIMYDYVSKEFDYGYIYARDKDDNFVVLICSK